MTAWDTGTATSDSLRPFTSTAQVPAVSGSGPQYADQHADQYVDTYGGWVMPPKVRRRPAPLWLRLAVWFTAVLVLAGLAGIAIHQVRPSALQSLEPGKAHAAPASHPAASHPAAAPARPSAPSASNPVTETSTGPQAASVQVDTAQYTVMVVAQNRCWVQATDPSSATPQFASVLAAGAQQTFHPSNGQLDLNVGASAVTVSVVLSGKTTAAWQFTPPAAPYTLTFSSSR